MTPVSDLFESVEALTALIEADRKVPAMQARRDKATGSGKRKIQKLARDRFRKQKTSVLASSSLKKLHTALSGSLKEATSDRDRISAEISLALGAEVYGVLVTAGESETYTAAIRQAVDAGAAGVAELLNTTTAASDSFISEYLKDGGFTRLTGQIDKTTVDRIAAAVADSYESGASFDETVAAIRGEFVSMSQYRAKMIAQTELNDAYNQSIAHFGAEAGATRKSWETDAAPCPVCIENALQGEIDIDEDFGSGDDAPPAHPSCLCSLLVHANN